MTPSLSPEENQRAREVVELGRLGAASVQELIAKLDDRSWTVRRSVVHALAGLGDPAVEALCALLRHRRDDEDRLAAAVDALSAATGISELPIVELADAAEPAIVCDALQVLGRRKSVSALPTVVRSMDHPDDNVAVAAIEALGRIGGDGILEPLVRAVNSRNFFCSFPAIDVLGRSEDPRAVAPLMSLLGEPQYAMEATRALGRIGDHGAVRSLVALLNQGPPLLVRSASVALGEIDQSQMSRYGGSRVGEELAARPDREAASRRVLQALPSASAAEKQAMARVLGWLGGEGALAGLVGMLDADHETARVSAEALILLGPLGVKELGLALREGGSERREMLLPLMGSKIASAQDVVACLDDGPNVFVLACQALARIGDSSVVAAIVGRIGDADVRVSQAAAAAVQSLGSSETERLMLLAAESSLPRVRRAALRIIAYFGYASGIDPLLRAMNDPDEKIRDTATFGLPFIEDPRALSALLLAASHASPKTRAAAARALGQTKKSEDVSLALAKCMADSDAWVRYYACQSAGRLRDEGALTLIESLLRDPAAQVRIAAVEALAHIPGAAPEDALALAATSTDGDTARAALTGLGVVKSARGLDLLTAALHENESATRLVAISAIARFESAAATALLAAATRDPDDAVRMAAVNLLGDRADAGSTAALLAALSNSVTTEGAAAALAHAMPGRIGAVALALRDADARTAALLVSVLSRMRVAEAISAIIGALADGNVYARRAVARALASTHWAFARDALVHARAHDPDEEVREICAAAISE